MRRIVAALFLLLAAAPAYAQIEECTFFKRQIDALIATGGAPVNPPSNDPAVIMLSPGRGARCYAVYVANADRANRLAFSDFVKKFEGSRTDEQSGTTSGTSGTTSVVSQGPAARVLSIAAEYGAITEAVNGQVVTVRGNLAGVPSALVKHDIFPYCVGAESRNDFCVGGSMLSLLRHVSIGVSFDMSRETQTTAIASVATGGAAQPVTFTPNRNDIEGISARVELWNRRQTTSKAFLEQWKARIPAAMDRSATDLLLIAGKFYDDVTSQPGYDQWHASHLARLRAAAMTRDRQQVIAALNDALRDFLTTLATDRDAVQAEAEAAISAYSRFFLAQDELLDSLSTTVVTLEYANNRPAGQPVTTDVRLIADIPIADRTKLVLNGGVTLYDNPKAIASAGVARLRDAQVAAELDQSLGASAITGPLVFTLAGYFQYQHSPAVLNVDATNPVPGVAFVGLSPNASTVFTTTGNIVLGQARLTFTPPSSGIKIPISVTFANRSELIDKATWRAQVGVTYDFDSLFAAFTK
jgi:hypothetical protein